MAPNCRIHPRSIHGKQRLGAAVVLSRPAIANFKNPSTGVTITPDKKDIYIAININEVRSTRSVTFCLAGDLTVSR